jgi:hypothetical protein
MSTHEHEAGHLETVVRADSLEGPTHTKRMRMVKAELNFFASPGTKILGDAI